MGRLVGDVHVSATVRFTARRDAAGTTGTTGRR